MSNSTIHILSGPKDDYDIPKASLGKIIFDRLRKRKPNDILNIDAITKEVLTCGKLLEHSIKLVTVLKNLGIEQGDVIAIISENDINYFIPIMAALYMGVTVNPLNPGYSVGELMHGLLISKAKLIFCSERALETVLKVKDELKFIETILLMGATHEINCNVRSFENLLEDVTAEIDGYEPKEFDYTQQVAFIFPSSGTTGLPKGVMITHQNLRTPMGYLSHPNYGNTTSEDITIVVMPFFHVYGSILQLLTMITSMTSVVMDKFKPDIFLECIQQHKVTKLFTVPPLVVFLAKSPLVENYDLSSIKDIQVGAAPLGKELIIEATKRLGNVAIRQSYGLTETCGPIAFQTVDYNEIGTVGGIVPGAIAKVRNPNTTQILGPLETGEICFKGPMVTKGYIPAQNCFDENGFFLTGDLGYYDHNGFFYIVGRTKELIKYKGFQVAPAELEALILTHDLVKDCGVIGIPDERAGEVPVAFVVLKNGPRIAEQEIVNFVAERISIQKRLYGGVRFIKEIPKTPSGKIMRQKLAQIFKSSEYV